MIDRRKTLIFFDIGGVLLSLDYSSFYQAAADLSSGNLTADEFKKEYFRLELEKKALLGNITIEDYLKAIQNIISGHLKNRVPTLEDITEALKCCWKEEIKEMVDLKKKLYQQGYTIGIFSNTGALHLQIINQMFPEISQVYDDDYPVILSFEEHSIKPEAKMYQQITGYDQVILIEDKPSYLKTAIEDFSWQGILLTAYIDPAEAIRQKSDDQVSLPKEKCLVAESPSDCLEALRKFGIEI